MEYIVGTKDVVIKYQFPATGREQLELEKDVYLEIPTTVVMVVGLRMPAFLIPKVNSLISNLENVCLF